MCHPAPTVSATTAFAYHSKLPQLISLVNRRLLDRPDLAMLIGSNPTSIMLGNHENHGRFLASWFQVAQTGLLRQTMRWAVDSYSNRGFAAAYFTVELEAWIEAITEQIEEPARSELVALYRWMLDQLAEPEQNPAQDDETVSGPLVWTEEQEKLLSFLLAGDHRAALALTREQLNRQAALSAIYLDLLQPVLYQVGLLWQQGRISVAHEHLATSIVLRIMASLYEHFPQTDRVKGKFVIASPTGEQHEIGARMIADLLELDGWQVLCMGANTPVEDLINLLIAEKPLALGLSVTMSYNLGQLADTLARIRSVESLAGLRILAGGHALQSLEQTPDWLQAVDALPRDAAGLLRVADSWSVS